MKKDKRIDRHTRKKAIEEKIKEGNIPVKIKTHKDKQGGHFHVILGKFFDNGKEQVVSAGLTTSEFKGKNSKNKNKPLQFSPRCDGKNSYMCREGTVDVKEMYHRPEKGVMAPEDLKTAKMYGEKAKKKYFNRKGQKK